MIQPIRSMRQARVLRIARAPPITMRFDWAGPPDGVPTRSKPTLAHRIAIRSLANRVRSRSTSPICKAPCLTDARLSQRTVDDEPGTGPIERGSVVPAVADADRDGCSGVQLEDAAARLRDGARHLRLGGTGRKEGSDRLPGNRPGRDEEGGQSHGQSEHQAEADFTHRVPPGIRSAVKKLSKECDCWALQQVNGSDYCEPVFTFSPDLDAHEQAAPPQRLACKSG
ncbi:hypothetical protein BOSE127_170097 [Bosea sp. 127]|nr:hypothetical protein BOSE127_170097 [Bosea sp. 127]